MKRSCDCLNNIVFCSNRDQQFYQSDRQQGTSGFTESSNTSWTTGHFFTETKPSSRSLQQPFHCNSPFIAATVSLARRSQLSFHREDGAATLSCTQRMNTHLGDKTIFSLQPPFHWQDRVSRPFIAAILSLGRRSWPLFHANPKLSTVSLQDKWLRLNELGHLRYDAKTRAPVLLLSLSLIHI